MILSSRLLHTAQRVAYHLSQEIFTEFSPDRVGRGIGNLYYGWGIYLGLNKSDALYYMNKVKKTPGPVYLYEVSVPPGDYLDECQPFSEQSSGVKGKLLSSGLHPEIIERVKNADSGQTIYRSIEGFQGSAREASKFLHDLGIVGSKTEDVLVVYRPSEARILSRSEV